MMFLMSVAWGLVTDNSFFFLWPHKDPKMGRSATASLLRVPMLGVAS